MNIGELIGLSCICLVTVAPSAYEGAHSPPKPADEGPSLEATMKFIQQEMREQEQIDYVRTYSHIPGVTFRYHYSMSKVLANATTCRLHTAESYRIEIEVAKGYTYSPAESEDSGSFVDTSDTSLKNVEKIIVSNQQDDENRRTAEQAQPDNKVTITPTVFSFVLSASKPIFIFRREFKAGKVSESSGKENFYTFRDEETANRVAKAMVHAVELCGGGSKPEPF